MTLAQPTLAGSGSGHGAEQPTSIRTPRPRWRPGLRRATREQPTGNSFRGDVAGLRAVAVGLVLLYHAGLPWLPGGFVGVDVFFVISGFLITGQLVKEIERTGRISLSAFYARRAKRILPAAAVVLVVTAALVWRFVPRTSWQEIGGDIVGAATYVVNWRLADRAVDYLAQDAQPSPVQHFWSLAVEEQFYIVWPLLILAAILAARLLRRGVTPILWVGLLVVALPSFAWSISETKSSPAQAFFMSTTRMWELAIGAGIALVGSRWARMPRGAAVVSGWLGLAAVVTAGLLVTAGTAWPGYAAALPTLGAAAVLAAGASAGRAGPVALLGTRPFRWVGDLSYSLYLWHWPLLVIATAHWHGLSVTRGLAITAASVIPAWITYRLVENPLRYSAAVSRSPRLALSLGANFTLVGVSAGLALLVLFSTASGGAAAPRTAPGAAVLAANPLNDPRGRVTDQVPFITPDPLKAKRDLPDTYQDKCHQDQMSATVLSCTYGDRNSATEVVLAGDSKIEQWLPAFQVLATRNHWKLTVYIKSNCPLSSADHLVIDTKKRYPSCTEWNNSLLTKLVADRPDYVVTSQYAATALDGDGKQSVDAMVAGMHRSWRTLAAVGTKVIVIANNPDPGLSVYKCVDQNRSHLSSCAFDRGRHDADRGYQTQRAAVPGTGVPMIDLFDAICPVGPCAPVIGNVLLYRDTSHLTSTYVRSMTPRLAVALAAVGLPAR
ncbi:acyltransferase family protein [Micromonospora soli]|uniref:acyltransferase family protein n=1 Tax=Micromonospora sp. NBRC 110009 TaxID=3061627 RepID=UPI0026730BD9|nr:acyltransferase family protein [Micromonospora sp. NBRC 110009]WKT99769.1 acyltransferase family protein [Micromonospora sp. NBRC 110009]